MSFLDWNSIENSRYGITDSKKGPHKNNPSQSSSIKEILPPLVVKNPDNFLITFDIKLKTQVLLIQIK
jgi:hypothetical protein